MYGLTSAEWRAMYRIFDALRGGMQRVILFGSRARGDYRRSSDVDLAVIGDRGICERLRTALEESALPYTFDVALYEDDMNAELRRQIDREGKLLYRVEKEGCIMTVEQVRLKWENYHRALMRLQEVLAKDPDVDDAYVDASIQRFEFCFELAWKWMRSMLSYEGIEVGSPRSSIREGWKQGLIEDAVAWLEMLEKRNLSTHTYDVKMARRLYDEVKGKYVELFIRLDLAGVRRLSDMDANEV